MTHKGRLGNFLPKYADTIINAVLSGSAPPSIKTPEDLLSFADERLSPRGEENYSNLGLLLVGLSLQSLTKKPFKELLQKYVLKEAHVACFSSEKPPNGRVNKEDPIEEHMCGSPAGGYWTTAEDLSRFGSWLASLCNDPTYSEYFKRFGTEFYRDGEIQHRGGCFSGSAYLSAFPEHGVVVSIVSDGGLNAAEVYATIRIYMLHLPVQG
jgi:CubicO group peptidase (beta-lactamase class C family)